MTSASQSPSMLAANGLECVRGERTLFRDLSLHADAGELLHVAGANGAGKTTLLRVLAGLSWPDVGIVTWGGSPIRALRESYASQLMYVGHAAALKDDLTVLENVRFAAQWRAQRARDDALAALDRLGVAHTADLYAKQLSQGQRRRITLARLFVGKTAPLWLLDEPFAALDGEATGIVEQAITSHLAHGGMVVLTTHHPLGLLDRTSRRITLDRNVVC